MNLKSILEERHHDSSIDGVDDEFKKLHTEKTPESWKDLFFFEMFKTGKVHVVPASAVCISVDPKKGELFTCPIGEFKYTGTSCDLIAEIMKGRRIFPVLSIDRAMY